MSASIFETIHADPWTDGVVDLPQLNADASKAIEDAVGSQRDVARKQPSGLRTTSLVVLGAPGAGKTHLFARLRQRLGPKAVFVHVRPLLNSEMTARFVLQEIAKQLGYATMGLRQADALVGALLAHLGGSVSPFPRAFLDDFAREDEPARARRIDEAVEEVLSTWQDADEIYLRRLLSVPFASAAAQRALLSWLSGRECDEVQLARIGASVSLPEESVVAALRTLAVVASLGAPLVVVFDQLENLIDGSEARSRLVAYGNLAAELVDSTRGMVLVHMAIESEWKRAIEPALGPSQRSRIAMRAKLLSLPTSAEKEQLLRLWAGRIPDPQAPFPWPFGERRVGRWCGAPGMTPRMLLVECRRVLEGGEDADTSSDSLDPSADVAPAEDDAIRDALAEEWNKQLESARRDLDEASSQERCVEPARLADGLVLAARFVDHLSVAVDFREIAQLTVRSGATTLRLAVLDQSHPGKLGSALSKLTTLAERERVIAVRERAREIAPTWKATLAKRAAFAAMPQARWTPLEREDAARLLALASLFTAARSGDVTDLAGRAIGVEAVTKWAASALDVTSWPIVGALVHRSVDGPSETEEPLASPQRAPAAADIPMSVMVRLRVASVDRLVREVARIDPASTRASTLQALERATDRLQWIGGNGAIVCMKEPS